MLCTRRAHTLCGIPKRDFSPLPRTRPPQPRRRRRMYLHILYVFQNNRITGAAFDRLKVFADICRTARIQYIISIRAQKGKPITFV